MARKQKPRMGRPPKETKFDAAISFPCFKALVQAADAYQQKQGFLSRGEAIRRLLESGLRAEGLLK